MSVLFRFGGAHVEGSQTRFRVFAPEAKACALRLFDQSGAPLEIFPMHPVRVESPDQFDQVFECTLDGYGPGTLYKFVLDGTELPDPYARYLPHGVHGPAMVVEPQPPRSQGPQRSLSEQVIYELHVGTFTEQGTYRAASSKLKQLVDLGVTTLELMPLSSFAGTRGWGYDGVAHFAPFAPYGTPDELRAFVDVAPSLGLAVLLDAVYNHFGPAGNYLASFSQRYFDRDVHNAWGSALNFSLPALRAYVLDNARYWLEEYGFDGLRLDAVHAIQDRSPKHILHELAELAQTFDPPKLMIAEDDRNDPDTVKDLGLDAVWADDFHHQVRVSLTGETDGYYKAYRPGVVDIARTLQQGWLYQGQVSPTHGEPRGKPAKQLAASCFVYCIQNHDQIGNRALGDRLTGRISLAEYTMASAILLFVPMTPLLFMGQEWAASTPFLFFTDHDPELGALVSSGRREEFKHFQAFADPRERQRIPDPQALATFENSRLRWSEREEPSHRPVLSLYRALLKLRREDPVLKHSSREQMRASADGDVLMVRRWSGSGERLLCANFGSAPRDLESLGIPATASVMLDTQAFFDKARAPIELRGPESALAHGQAVVIALARDEAAGGSEGA
jgi:maltooligosyltrehalose trehalohydrolase